MIKIVSQTYFSDFQEVHNLNQHLRENPESKDIFLDYIKKNFNATYKHPSYWGEIGYFLFEDERDAIMFTLRWP